MGLISVLKNLVIIGINVYMNNNKKEKEKKKIIMFDDSFDAKENKSKIDSDLFLLFKNKSPNNSPIDLRIFIRIYDEISRILFRIFILHYHFCTS